MLKLLLKILFKLLRNRWVLTLLAIHVFIGLLVSPFIHSNNANQYRDNGWARAISSSSLYWPSYVFTTEPVIDSTSLKTFRYSSFDLLTYRSERAFTGPPSKDHEKMFVKSLSYCMARESANKDFVFNLLEDVTSGGEKSEEIQRTRKIIIDKMDGFTFSDVIEAGHECNENLVEDFKDATTLAIKDSVINKVVTTPEIANLEGSMADIMPVDTQPTTNAESVFDAAAAKVNDQYESQWLAIKNDPAKFLSVCTEQGASYSINMGGAEPVQATKDAELECSWQLTELKSCMEKESPNASECNDKVFNNGKY